MAETTRAVLRWEGGMRFSALAGSGREVVVDAPSRPDHAGPSPMEMLLIGVAGCTAMDVVAILEKMRVPLAAVTVEAAAERAPANPKRFTAVELRYRLRGDGLTLDKAERAVSLSLSTYCSAVASLHPDCRVSTAIEIEES